MSLLFCLPSLQAAPLKSLDQAAAFFQGYQGTFVLYDESAAEYSVYNQPQSEKQLTPCSSFKIYNSLIALETGVAADETLVIPWNGQPSSITGWNQDHTLASAIKNSVVWYYQALAERIGPQRMQQHLDAMPYGNRDISGGLTRFWLHTSLTISAREQVDLLRRLYQDDLPFSQRNMAIVRKIIIQSEADGVRFSGKTGSAYVGGQFTVGWLVGAVERNNRRYFFAVNIEGEKEASGVKACSIAVDVLKSLAILP
jgi:bla regulator protein BlaR1